MSGRNGELIARVFVARASCKISIGNPTADSIEILEQTYSPRVPRLFLHSTYSALLPIFNRFQ